MTRFACFIAALFVVQAPNARASVLVVDAAGGGSYLEISAATAAAASGDTILIKTGAYDPFVVSGKSLVLAADSGAIVLVRSFLAAGSPTIEWVPAGGSVVVRGLSFLWSPLDFTTSGLPSLWLRHCDGGVRLESCSVTGAVGSCDGSTPIGIPGAPALKVENCASVALVRCTIRGGEGDEGTVFASCCSDGGAGLVASSSQIAAYETTILGGVGGSGCQSGMHEVVPSGALLKGLGAGRTFSLNSPIRPGDTGALVFTGPPGEAVLLFIGTSPLHVPKLQFAGVFLVDPVLVASFSTIPGSGQITVLVTANSLLPAGVSALSLSLQPVYSGVVSDVIGPPTFVTLLGPGL